MKIFFDVLKNNKYPSFKASDYKNRDFISQNPQKSEIDMIVPIVDEYVKSNPELKSNDLLYSIGKIFERFELYSAARTFFEKIKQNALETGDSKLSSEIDIDLYRIINKEE